MYSFWHGKGYTVLRFPHIKVGLLTSNGWWTVFGDFFLNFAIKKFHIDIFYKFTAGNYSATKNALKNSKIPPRNKFLEI